MEIHNGGNFHYSDYKITAYSFWPNNLLLAIFKVTEAILSIFNPKYLIAGIVITLIHAPPSTNIPHNTDPLHCTSMIGSHSCSTAMAFKGVGTFGTLGVDNPFLNSFQVNDTIITNYPMVIFAFYDPTSFTIE
jgi:hypothetical protein